MIDSDTYKIGLLSGEYKTYQVIYEVRSHLEPFQ